MSGEAAADGAAPQLTAANVKRYLAIFREMDGSGDGNIDVAELQTGMERVGIRLSQRDFANLVEAVDVDGDHQVCFAEFVELARKLTAPVSRAKAKITRLPRMYLNPEQYTQYQAAFREAAGKDMQVSFAELQALFSKYGMNMAPDRLQAIMSEVDEDQSGFLDEIEFLTLLIKASGMKKRKLGPDHCDISMLVHEGWLPGEIKKAGYEGHHFLQAGFSVEEVLEHFSIPELRKAGVTFAQLLEAGWDCYKACEGGFELQQLVTAGRSMEQIRLAGYEDPVHAAELRNMGISVNNLRLGGWPLSDLRTAGFSMMDLRLGGFSAASLAALQQLHDKTSPQQPIRKGTYEFRAQMQQLLQGKHGVSFAPPAEAAAVAPPAS